MVPPPSESSSKRSSIFGAVTIVLSLACLAWALHGLNWSELWEDIRELDWRWVAVACVADVLVYVIQGWRWSLLLRPVGPASIGSSVRAIFVGLFASEVFPVARRRTDPLFSAGALDPDPSFGDAGIGSD